MMPCIFSTPRLSDNSWPARLPDPVDIEKTSEPFRLNVKCKIAYLARSDVWSWHRLANKSLFSVSGLNFGHNYTVLFSLSFTFPSKKYKDFGTIMPVLSMHCTNCCSLSHSLVFLPNSHHPQSDLRHPNMFTFTVIEIIFSF